MRLIPRRIFQSWKTKQLPPLIQENVEQLKNLNPEYTYELSDDEDCRMFLKQHFGQRYVDAFNSILPGAFKCDFWRYAKLYIEGGVYLDLDMYPEMPLDAVINNGDQLVTVVDRKKWHPPCAIYQAFVATMPKHPILKIALELTLENIENQKMVENTGLLDITGPVVMGRAFNIYWYGKNTIDDIRPGVYDSIRLYYNREDDSTVDLQGRIIFRNKVDGYMNVAVNYYGNNSIKLYAINKRRRNYMCIFIILILIYILVSYRHRIKKLIKKNRK